MKIDDQMRFPHPVLWAQTSDYKEGEFSVELAITESLDTGRLDLQYKVNVAQPEMLLLVEQGKAKLGFFVTCLDTYFNELMPIADEGGTLEIAAGLLKGRVILRPVIWSVERIEDFHSNDLHEEFGSVAQIFSQYDVLALGEETVINVGREKLFPIKSIFSLSRNDDVPQDQIRIEMEGEEILILAPDSTFDKIHRLRGTRAGKALLLNSIYLPAVMGVLSTLREDSSVYEGKRWNRIFVAKAQYLGINLQSGDPLEAAQRLLKSPFGRVQGEKELRYV